MTTKINEGSKNPTVNLAVNKSRVKMYDKASNMPTFYLKKGEEFQIELFNPTTDTLLATIKLNNKKISNGGLVLRPGERVFLDRFLDVNKKFLFDTYEVSSSDEVRKAIEKNGDLEVSFYKQESIPVVRTPLTWTHYNQDTFGGSSSGNPTYDLSFTTSSNSGEATLDMMDTSDISLTSTFCNSVNMDILRSSKVDKDPVLGGKKRHRKGIRSKKTIETGTVEQGSVSNQEFKTVDKKFESYPLANFSFKILPISQKPVTTNDLRHSFCTNCGVKNSSKNNFCPKCGNKI